MTAEAANVAHSSLDATGKRITTFIAYEAARRLESLDESESLEILTDDFEPIGADLAAWCEATGHRLVESAASDGGRRFLIEKGPPRATGKRLAMVVSTDGLEELLSPLGFALAAALEGIEVHLFFQGPAVRVLTKGFRPKLRGLARPFSRLAAAAMQRTGHVAAQEKVVQLRGLGARLYICGPSMEHFKVSEQTLLFDDLTIVEYLSFMRVMAEAEIQLYA